MYCFDEDGESINANYYEVDRFFVFYQIET